MRIYVASSWRNKYQPEVVKMLRAHGHEVYDFRNPKPGDHGFSWSEIDENWKNWTREQYIVALSDSVAEDGFYSDFNAMKWADVILGVMPFGRSASLEVGWGAGANKHTAIYFPEENPGEPELMVHMCEQLLVNMGEVIEWLELIDSNMPLMTEAVE